MGTTEILSVEDWAFIKESLQHTKKNFENYTRYPDQEFKAKRVADASLILTKVDSILKEMKSA